QTHATSAPAMLCKLRTTLGPQYPYPITPNLTMLTAFLANGYTCTGSRVFGALLAFDDITVDSFSVCAFKYSQGRTQQNFHIQPTRPCFGIPEVEAHHIVKLYAVTTTHLPKPRDSGFCLKKSATMPQLVMFHFVWKRRTRAN